MSTILKLMLRGNLLLFTVFTSLLFGRGIIINNNSIKKFDQIPEEWIKTAKNNINLHYQTASQKNHPENEVKKNETYLTKIDRMIDSLSNVPGALNIYVDTIHVECENISCNSLSLPTLEKNSSLNVSLGLVTSALNLTQELPVSIYLNIIEALERKYPEVIFIYTTEEGGVGEGCYNEKNEEKYLKRNIRNKKIRQYCKQHNKILFDLADINCQENEKIAKAFWYMMARIAGWDGVVFSPANLVRFDGIVSEEGVELIWGISSEYNDYCYEIERSTDHKHYERIDIINNKGTTAELEYYRFLDHDPPGNKIYYRLKRIDFNGRINSLLEVEVSFKKELLKSFKFYQNYPNSFKQRSALSYSLPSSQIATFKVYDSHGKEAITLLHQIRMASNYNTAFDEIESSFNKLSLGLQAYDISLMK